MLGPMWNQMPGLRQAQGTWRGLLRPSLHEGRNMSAYPVTAGDWTRHQHRNEKSTMEYVT